jgi:prephenate dehydratase
MAEHERPVVAFLGPEASYTHQVRHFHLACKVYSVSLFHLTCAIPKSIFQVSINFAPILPLSPKNINSQNPQAALDAFPNQTVTLSPQITIADVFTAVQNGTAHRGVVPFENSSNGSVVFTLDLIGDIHGTHPDILVCGESYVAVRHCLLGHAVIIPNASTSAPRADIAIDTKFTNPLATPKSDLTKIKKLYSHPQAWGQCKAFLSTYLKGVERQDVSSTSKAAEIVAQDTSGESAALSSHVAAELFGLDVLAESINDHVGNATRFLVIRRNDSPLSSTPAAAASSPHGSASNEGDNWKTLVTFTVDHANPGALAHCLAAFEKFGLNLTSINTRPSGVRNWHYVFFVELKGRREGEGDGDGEGEVDKALRELGNVASEWRWKGSWENRL